MAQTAHPFTGVTTSHLRVAAEDLRRHLRTRGWEETSNGHLVRKSRHRFEFHTGAGDFRDDVSMTETLTLESAARGRHPLRPQAYTSVTARVDVTPLSAARLPLSHEWRLTEKAKARARASLARIARSL